MTCPEDIYVTDGVDVAAIERYAERCVDLTGTPQRIHDHPAGGRCRDGCRVVGE